MTKKRGIIWTRQSIPCVLRQRPMALWILVDCSSALKDGFAIHSHGFSLIAKTTVAIALKLKHT